MTCINHCAVLPLGARSNGKVTHGCGVTEPWIGLQEADANVWGAPFFTCASNHSIGDDEKEFSVVRIGRLRKGIKCAAHGLFALGIASDQTNGKEFGADLSQADDLTGFLGRQ